MYLKKQKLWKMAFVLGFLTSTISMSSLAIDFGAFCENHYFQHLEAARDGKKIRRFPNVKIYDDITNRNYGELDLVEIDSEEKTKIYEIKCQNSRNIKKSLHKAGRQFQHLVKICRRMEQQLVFSEPELSCQHILQAEKIVVIPDDFLQRESVNNWRHKNKKKISLQGLDLTYEDLQFLFSFFVESSSFIVELDRDAPVRKVRRFF